MQLISKKEKDMTTEEKTKLELMRSLYVLFYGARLYDETEEFDLTFNSKMSARADMIFERFNVSLKNQNEVKMSHPDELVVFPGKPGYEQMISTSPSITPDGESVKRSIKNAHRKMFQPAPEPEKEKESVLPNREVPKKGKADK